MGINGDDGDSNWLLIKRRGLPMIKQNLNWIIILYNWFIELHAIQFHAACNSGKPQKEGDCICMVHLP